MNKNQWFESDRQVADFDSDTLIFILNKMCIKYGIPPENIKVLPTKNNNDVDYKILYYNNVEVDVY